MTTFLFLRITHDLCSCLQSGDTRRAAHSSVRPDPGAGSSCLRRFARPRYRSDRPTSRCFRTASRVGIDVHGSLDRVKDVSSRVEALVGRLPHRVRTPVRTLTTFPSSLFQRTPVVAGATVCMGTSPAAAESDRPRPTFFRQPAKVAGAWWTRVPSTVASAGT
jgi:hypothetical protein